uniref:Uncharacterized protein n=1 Tax=Candidatus Kentrum sp. FM TaxID=2126340 RepID=A0A450SSM0_9GAMM|nr:MAG: hypothetical protein BECKFM1743C_GA0114222_101904 [Candidatus Kentron sp. FM]VFJ57054.1 MAG: hypothetical protein BECKFM1743A_GA0114220_101815 [Candidatus Kentron sp. FM]VFK11509.1 MAG: hypothetical protein BECKFM1743B_GA0114221_101874 [Candidatus Kentron sp. FM]
MADLMTVGMMLTATDRMSGVVVSASNRAMAGLGAVQARMAGMADTAGRLGRAAMTHGAVLAGSVAGPP